MKTSLIILIYEVIYRVFSYLLIITVLLNSCNAAESSGKTKAPNNVMPGIELLPGILVNEAESPKKLIDQLDYLNKLLSSNPRDMDLIAERCHVAMKLLNEIGPYAIFGDPRLAKVIDYIFENSADLFGSFIFEGNNDPAILDLLAQYHLLKSIHRFVAEDTHFGPITAFQAMLYYMALSHRHPEEPKWHRATGLSYLTMADSFPLLGNDLYLNLRLFVGDAELERYPESERNVILQALPLELAVEALETTIDLAPDSLQLACELSQARKRAADAMQRLGYPQYGTQYANRVNMVFCDAIEPDETLFAARDAAGKIVAALKLDEIIENTQFNAFRVIETRFVNRLSITPADSHYLAFWYGTLGYLALLQPLNFHGTLPADIKTLALTILKGAVSLEPDNKLLNAYLNYANGFQQQNPKTVGSNSEGSDKSPKAKSDSIYYDWQQLRAHGLGMLYKNTIQDILDCLETGPIAAASNTKI